MQSDLKIGSALAERVGHGDVGGCHPLGYSAWRLLQLAMERPGQCDSAWRAVAVGYRKGLDSAWWLLQLAIEKAWSAPDGPFSASLHK